MNINITEVKVIPIREPRGAFRAYAQIVIDNCFLIRNFRVIEGTNGLFVGMPSIKNNNEDAKNKHRNIAHPTNRECHIYLENKILDEYERVINGGSIK